MWHVRFGGYFKKIHHGSQLGHRIVRFVCMPHQIGCPSSSIAPKASSNHSDDILLCSSYPESARADALME